MAVLYDILEKPDYMNHRERNILAKYSLQKEKLRQCLEKIEILASIRKDVEILSLIADMKRNYDR